MKKRNLLLVAILTYMIFAYDLRLSYVNTNKAYNVKYTGLVWVALDYYTILKYNSTDVPMKWIDYSVEAVKK